MSLAARRLLALITALSLLLALPMAGADAKRSPKSAGAKKAALKRCKAKAAKRTAGKSRAKRRKAMRKCRRKAAKKAAARRPVKPVKPGKAVKKKRPPVTAPPSVAPAGPVGRVSAVTGDLVTVALTRGGTLSGRVTDDSLVICAEAEDAYEEDEGAADEDLLDDVPPEDDTSDAADEHDSGSAALGGCSVPVGAPVFAADVQGGVVQVLDLVGA